MRLGAAIRKIRLERGRTLEQVALEVDTYAGNLSKIERDQQPPSVELLHKISAALGVKMSELYAIAEETCPAVINSPHSLATYDNDIILMRRHFQALSSANKGFALEMLKSLCRLQQEGHS